MLWRMRVMRVLLWMVLCLRVVFLRKGRVLNKDGVLEKSRGKGSRRHREKGMQTAAVAETLLAMQTAVKAVEKQLIATQTAVTAVKKQLLAVQVAAAVVLLVKAVQVAMTAVLARCCRVPLVLWALWS